MLDYIKLMIEDFRTHLIVNRLKKELVNCMNEKDKETIEFKILLAEALPIRDYHLYTKNNTKRK